MRRNTEEVKQELSRRLDEYKEKRRVRRKLATVCLTVALCSAVTVAAVPAMVAREKSDVIDEHHAVITDGLDSITVHYAGDVQPNATDRLWGANDGGIGKIQGVDKGDTEIIEGVEPGTTEKSEDVDEGTTEITMDITANGSPGSAGDMRVTFRDFPGLSGEKAEPIVNAYEALELERVEGFSGEVILTFDLRHGDADTVILELTDKDELLIRIEDYMAEATYYTANNMYILKDALKDVGVFE